MHARQKFCGLLPEVNKRRLFERRGFASIYEFAAKLAGISHEQVNTILCLDRRFEGKPLLRRALTEGKISVNKLARVVSIATAENQEEIFTAGKILSKASLEVFVKDYKNDNRDGFCKPLYNPQSLPGQEVLASGQEGDAAAKDELSAMHSATKSQNFDYEILAALSPELKQKIKEMIDKGHDINALLLQFFKQCEEKIEQEKTKLAEEQKQKQQEEAIIGIPASRYISVKIRKIIHEEHGNKCSIPGCGKPAKELHHAARFSIAQVHDPRFLAPLCVGHHELAHRVDVSLVRWRGKT